MNRKQLLTRLARGAVKNVQFSAMIDLVEGFGFRLNRVRGSHPSFVHPDVPEMLNLQPDGGQAKAYQIRQFLRLIEEHELRLED